MRGLAGDRGGMAVSIGVLFALLLPIMVMTVDAGMIYQERRELQNGADAGALAIAYQCARGEPCDQATISGLASAYASANAISDGSAFAFDPAVASQQVTVSTRSQDAGGGVGLLLVVAQLVGIDSATVHATAVAEWTNIGEARVPLPITLCDRQWNHHTGGGTSYGGGPYLVRWAPTPPGPPGGGPPGGGPPGGGPPGGGPPGGGPPGDDPPGPPEPDLDPHEVCGGPAGDTFPGGFGFLHSDADCSVYVTAGGTVGGSTGDVPNPAQSCGISGLVAAMDGIIAAGETVLIPIFDQASGQGANGQYHIVGFGAFRLVGYYLKNGNHRRNVSAGECSAPYHCLKGAFENFVPLQDAVPDDTVPGFGAYWVRLVG